MDNKEHTYLLDFKIKFNSGEICYIETKGYVKENDLLKWKSIKDQNLKIKVWFNKNLRRLEKFMKRQQKLVAY